MVYSGQRSHPEGSRNASRSAFAHSTICRMQYSSDSFRVAFGVPHQVEVELFPALRRPEIREGENLDLLWYAMAMGNLAEIIAAELTD